MKFKVKYIQIKLYQSRSHPFMGWSSDKKSLKTRIRRYELGKRLAASSKAKRKRKEEESKLSKMLD